MDAQDFRTSIIEAGLTFKEAAKRMGVSEPTMRRLVSPSRTKPIPLRDVLALSAALFEVDAAVSERKGEL